MSRFFNQTSDFNSENSAEIDFDNAINLKGDGTTCDIYRTKWQRRDVFVKRLKAEYRSNPLYLDALDKEFEIGVRLKHPSLPQYLEFHRNYIIMEYVDGITLAEMIRRQDTWLSTERNIIKMLGQLVKVVDYLHFHNITHCDIKADNILITANNHNLVLIDFDKSYTDSLNDTSGDPSKYGLTASEVGKISLDFRGIAKVVENLKGNIPDFKFNKYKDFIDKCYEREPSTGDLLNVIDDTNRNRDRSLYWLVTFTPFFVAIIFGFFLWLFQGKKGYDDSYGVIKPSEQVMDSIIEEPLVEQKAESPRQMVIPEDAYTTNSTPQTQQQLHEHAKEMAKALDRRIAPMYAHLNNGLDSLILIAKDTTLSRNQLLSLVRQFVDEEDEYKEETFGIVNDMFPGLSERDAWRILSYSKIITVYNKRSNSELKEIRTEIERRE